jgi:hypothetical protein
MDIIGCLKAVAGCRKMNFAPWGNMRLVIPRFAINFMAFAHFIANLGHRGDGDPDVLVQLEMDFRLIVINRKWVIFTDLF